MTAAPVLAARTGPLGVHFGLVELDLLATHAGTTRIHESFHVDRPTSWTRAWFSWAEAMFSELVLDYCGFRHADAEPG